MFISVFLFLNENVYTSVFSYFCKCLKILQQSTVFRYVTQTAAWPCRAQHARVKPFGPAVCFVTFAAVPVLNIVCGVNFTEIFFHSVFF